MIFQSGLLNIRTPLVLNGSNLNYKIPKLMGTSTKIVKEKARLLGGNDTTLEALHQRKAIAGNAGNHCPQSKSGLAHPSSMHK